MLRLRPRLTSLAPYLLIERCCGFLGTTDRERHIFVSPKRESTLHKETCGLAYKNRVHYILFLYNRNPRLEYFYIWLKSVDVCASVIKFVDYPGKVSTNLARISRRSFTIREAD